MNGPDFGHLEEGDGDHTFENLHVWQDAVELAAVVYRVAGSCADAAFRRQLQAAAVSVSSNIAEGYERGSNPEFIRFLQIARGSCGEVRSQAHVAVKVALLFKEDATVIIDTAKSLSKRLGTLIKVRRERFG
jgi:four helix bundle protein